MAALYDASMREALYLRDSIYIGMRKQAMERGIMRQETFSDMPFYFVVGRINRTKHIIVCAPNAGSLMYITRKIASSLVRRITGIYIYKHEGWTLNAIVMGLYSGDILALAFQSASLITRSWKEKEGSTTRKYSLPNWRRSTNYSALAERGHSIECRLYGRPRRHNNRFGRLSLFFCTNTTSCSFFRGDFFSSRVCVCVENTEYASLVKRTDESKSFRIILLERV